MDVFGEGGVKMENLPSLPYQITQSVTNSVKEINVTIQTKVFLCSTFRFIFKRICFIR